MGGCCIGDGLAVSTRATAASWSGGRGGWNLTCEGDLLDYRRVAYVYLRL